MTRHRSRPAASPPHVEGDGRTVVVRLLAWDTAQEVTDDGRTFYREQFRRGSLRLVDGLAPVVREHGGPTIGRIVALDDDGTGPVATVRIANSGDGQDVLALLDEDALSASLEFDDDPTPARAGELVERTDAVLAGMAFTDQPQHTTAEVLARRSHRQETTVDDETTTDDQTTDDQTTDAAGDEQTTDASENTRQRSRPTPRPVAGPGNLGPARPANRPATSRFRSFGEFAAAAARGDVDFDERQRYYRALSSATTADATGLMRTQWINEVIDLIRPSQPTVQAFSQRPLPDKGTTVSQPTITTRPTTGKQSAQNAAVSSQKAVIAPVSWTVDTYGGGQEMSIQTVQRTEPGYLDEVMRLYTVEMALSLEADVNAGVVAAADDVNTAIELSNTASAYQDAFIDASAVIMGSLLRPAELAVLNIKMWQKLAKALDSTGRPLFPGLSPMNPQGSMSITDTTGEIRSLRYFVAPKMANTVALAVVGVSDAYRTMIGPMQTLQNDVPETLTQQHAVYEFAAHGKVDARGLVLINDLV